MNKYVLHLYITGQTPRSERAIANLQQLCANGLADQCEIIVIDVLERPQLAEYEKIMVTPTLVKHAPPPQRRVIGDLSDAEKVLSWLDLPTTAIANKREEGD
jgi:circadian clock protein KaiB